MWNITLKIGIHRGFKGILGFGAHISSRDFGAQLYVYSHIRFSLEGNHIGFDSVVS